MNDAIDAFLDRVGTASPTNHAMVVALRDIVRQAAPGAEESFKYGGIYYLAGRPFCGIFAYTNHVSIEFTRGAELDDPAGHLLGTGQYRRHMQFHTPDAIAAVPVAEFVSAAFAAA